MVLQVHHQLTVSTFYDPLEPQRHAIAGVLISNDKGEPIHGIGKHFDNIFLDCKLPCYIALLQGLELAWSKGFRYLQINLGYMLRECFWVDFCEDTMIRKYKLSLKTPAVDPRTLVILKTLEDYLNRKWVVIVKNTKSFRQDCDVLSVVLLADFEEQVGGVYDFRSHPLTDLFMGLAMYFKELAKLYATAVGADDEYFVLD